MLACFLFQMRIRRREIKRIYLTAADKPDRSINYRKLSWFVWGHYRHVVTVLQHLLYSNFL